MRNRINNFLIILLSCSFWACNPNNPETSDHAMHHDNLTVSDENFCNPERGFHVFKEFQGTIPLPAMDVSTVKTIYNTGYSLILTNYYLKYYRDCPLSEAYLDGVRANMQALRDGGCKCVLRFAYTDTDEYTKDSYAKNYEDPREAPVDVILQHIEQLKPILQEYVDVIYAMEAGFVGVWGEWYYTTNFKSNPKDAEDYADYKRVLDALLDALPKERQICVRTPAFKMNCYGWSLADTITRAEAYSGTPKSRLAGHDDAFMANSSDMGTFKSPTDRQYWEAESKYTIYGGESNKPGSYAGCENTLAQMLAMHMSYLNISYHKTVIARWQSGGCLEDIRRQLGYRFEGRDIAYTKNPKAGEVLAVKLSVVNVGYSAPKNPRDIEFLLINTADAKDVYRVVPDSDPRFWFTDEMQTIEASFVPKKAGAYKLYLNLPDPQPTLHTNPRYSIRLANTDCWEETTGYNYLTTIMVE